MAARTHLDRGWLAALALSVLTLGIFYVLQDYGPASTVRRFHRALADRDARALAQTIEQDLDTNVVAQVVWRVRSVDPTGRSYQMLRMDRAPREVRVEVAYRTPPGFIVVLPWVVRKAPGSASWRIDAERTFAWMQRYLMPGAPW